MKKLLHLSALIMSLSFAYVTFAGESYFSRAGSYIDYFQKWQENSENKKNEENRKKYDVILKDEQNKLAKNFKASDMINMKEQATRNANQKVFQAAKRKLNTSTFKYILSASTMAAAACYYYDQPLLTKGMFSAATIALGGLSYNHLTGLAQEYATAHNTFNDNEYNLEKNTLDNNQDKLQQELDSIQNREKFSFLQQMHSDNIEMLEAAKDEATEPRPTTASKKRAYTAASIFGFACAAPHLAPYLAPHFMPYLLNCSKYLPFFAKS